MGSDLAGADLSDGHDAFYNPELAKKYAAQAKSELEGSVSSFPIKLDIIYYGSSQTQANQASAFQQNLESVLDGLVKINLVVCSTTTEYYYSGYYADYGSDSNYDVYYGSGWGPDYADPQTYLAIFDPETGDMLNNFGLNAGSMEDADDKKAKEVTGFYAYRELLRAAEAETADTDKRYKLFAKAEATILDNALIVPYSTAGGQYAISRVRPYTAVTFPCGLSSNKMKGRIVEDHIVTLAEREQWKKEYESAKAAAVAAYNK